MLSLTFNVLYFSFIAYGLLGLSRDFIRYRDSMNKLDFEKSRPPVYDAGTRRPER
jgi:hypothetical protein